MIEVVVGGLYCVSQFGDVSTIPCPTCGSDDPGVYLVGDTPNPDWSRCACAFKPIHRPRPEFFAELLTPPVEAPNRVREAA